MEKKNLRKKVQSAKDILMGHDFFQQKAQAQKYITHEFQDYGYYLATELGDLQHRSIYMRLAKNTPKYILERALAFARDYKEPNRGKLFMWKLKQVREEIATSNANVNFDYEFVVKRMGKLYDKLAATLVKKYNSQSYDYVKDVIKHLNFDMKKVKVLVLDSNAGIVSDLLTSLGFKVTEYQISSSFRDYIKEKHPIVNVKKSFYKLGSNKENYFDLVWIGNYWNIVPLECEKDFLTDIYRVLKPSSFAFINLNVGVSDLQEWKEFTVGEKVDYRFTKVQKPESFGEKVQKHFEIIPLASEQENIKRVLLKKLSE